MNTNLDNILNKNHCVLKHLSNLEQNFSNLLSHENVLTYENCNNIYLSIETKINKLIIKKCNNFEIKINGLISGIDIEHSENIIVTNNEGSLINFILSSKSKNIRVKSLDDKFNKNSMEVSESSIKIVS